MNKTLLIFFILFLSVFKLNAKVNTETLVKTDSVRYYLQISEKFNQELDFKKSISYAEKAKNYAIRNSKNIEIAETNYILATLFLNNKEYEKAKNYFARSSSIGNKFNPEIDVLSHFKLASLYVELNDVNNAEKHFGIAEDKFRLHELNAPATLKQILLEKALLFQKVKNNDEAKKIYTTIIKDYKFSRQTIDAYVNLSNIVGKDSIQWAINSLKNIEKQYPDLDADTKVVLYYSLADLLVKNESPYLANFYLKQYINASKKKQNSSIIPFIKEDSSDILSLRDQTIIPNDKTIKFTKLISIMSIALIAILSLLSLSLYRNNKDRIKANELLQIKNNELEIAKNKAEIASKARTEFLSTVSHELRTPLNAINGITHILLEEKPKKSQLQYLKSLEFSGDYLLHFINDILEINRVESGNVEIEEINYDLRQLVENILESFSELSKKNEVICDLHIDSQIPPLLIGDPTKLSQIFMNLIGNSMKFSSKGKIWVNIKFVERIEDTVKLKMEIKDSGIGISEEKQKTIFENFTQGSVEINRKYGGTGLGLAIVKSLVQLLGGDIKLESQLGVGSTFYFTIQQKISEKAELIPIKVEYDEDILKGKHVLIVEDNKINQMITEKMLSKKQMTYVTIENGEESIRVARQESFDLILMDIHLPGINGTIAAQEIRHFDTHTPIIALTAISLNENREALLGYGMDEVITKPFQPEKFYETIALTLQKSVNSLHSL